MIDDATGGTVALKPVVAGEEVLVAEAQGGSDHAGGVHACAGAEHNAGRVDEEDLSGGGKPAVDGAGVSGEYAVQRDRRGAGLVEVHRGLCADVEGVPVDDGFVAGLVDGQAGGVLADGRCACGDRAAGGQGGGGGWACHGHAGQGSEKRCGDGL